MIIFELICSSQHRFEGWFSSHDAFEHQRQGGALSCPVCSTTRVEKLPAAKIRKPDNGRIASPPTAPNSETPPEPTALLTRFINHVLRHTEDVGHAFPEEAR